jgi:hypothetical protein
MYETLLTHKIQIIIKATCISQGMINNCFNFQNETTDKQLKFYRVMVIVFIHFEEGQKSKE